MGASVFSFLMSLIWCSAFLVVAVVWNKTMMLKHGTGFALTAIAIGIGRLILPLDLPASIIIRSISIMPTTQRYLGASVFNASNTTVTRFNILLAVWMAGSVIYLLNIAVSLLRQRRWISKMKLRLIPMAEEILGEIISKSRPGQKFYVFEADGITSPMLTGYVTPVILFPVILLSEKDMKYVLLHEWNHFLHKHLWIKLSFNIFCALLWWNPLVYMAKSDLDYILEVNCDRYVIRDLEQNNRPEYVTALAKVIKQLKTSMRRPSGTVGFIGMVDSKIVRRCELILYPPPKLRKWAKCVICVFLTSLLLLSYAFIFQTAYTPSQEDLRSSPGSNVDTSISPGNSYLVLSNNGTYTLYVNGIPLDTLEQNEIKTLPFSELPIHN